MSKLFYFAVPVLILATGISASTWSNSASAVKDYRRLGGALRTIDIQLPGFVEFAGEAFPAENWEVREKLEKELRKQLNHPEHLKSLMRRSARYESAFKSILRQYGVPEDFYYLAIAESHLTNVVSPAGATGFWQLMPVTARHYGLEVSPSVDERYHPEKSTHAAAKYLRDAYKALQDWTLVAAAYNMGHNGIAKALSRQGVSSYYELRLNKETSQYVFKVLGYKYLFESPARFGVSYASDTDGLKPMPWRTLVQTASIPDLEVFADRLGMSLAELRAYNPWLLSNELNVSEGKTYEIRFLLLKGLRVDELVVKGSKSPEITVDAPDMAEPYQTSNA